MTTPAPFISADDLRRTTFVRHVEIHDKLDSTNNRAAELAREASIELPALVVARHQSAGRGRGTKPWWSAEGALTFSVLMEPSSHGIATADWPQLSLATAVAICDALEPHLTPPRAGASPPPDNPSHPIAPRSPLPAPCSIKWPNDVLIGGRKIAGILIESPGGAAPAKDRLVVGVGVNVNNSLRAKSAAANDSAPTDLTLTLATSFCDITGHTCDLQQMLADVLRAIELRIAQLASKDRQLPTAWQQRSYLTERTVTVTNDGHKTTGRCLGIAADGGLLVQSNGITERIFSGSVSAVQHK